MVSIYQLKSRFQSLLRPFVVKLAQAGVTANQVTIAATLLSVVWGSLMAAFHTQAWPWVLLPLVLFVRMALNAVDGMLAREHGMKSKLGAILNELGDVVSDAVLYLPFALLENACAWTVVLLCILSVISEMTGVIAIQIGAGRRYDGPMGKSDRAFVFGALGFFLGTGMISATWLNIVFALTLALVVLTIFNRARNALKEAASHA